MADAEAPQKIFGIIGWKNAGKTTLVVRLIDHFVAHGLSVSTVKHAHHDFDIDHPGKDSYLHREAGASQVVIASDKRIAMLQENREPIVPSLEETLSWVDPCDLVLVEGFKRHPHPKIEVIRGDPTDEPVALTDSSVRAIATDRERNIGTHSQFNIEDVELIAEFILQETGLNTDKA
ncbi:molybdopterin-guanine dinucleotide biosynthesis protein B [Parvibaculaceae bacterium PLY_AMNH_Bact1]|nr:molybdopterin-guanine dinucleotide biosynthesis protein B [Parvibaculaceae bacterium PLY_AMNH_Bact1]